MTEKELKKNKMGYKPFKMLGHELPGIKQRGMPMRSFDASGGAINEEMVDKVDKNPGSGINYGAAAGSSPAKKWWKKAARIAAGVATGGISEVVRAAKNRREAAAADVAAAETAPVEGGGEGVVPPHGDEAHTGGAIGGEAEGNIPNISTQRLGLMGFGGAQLGGPGYTGDKMKGHGGWGGLGSRVIGGVNNMV